MPTSARAEILERCRAKVARGVPLRAGAIGAFSPELDFVVLHNFSKFGALGPLGGMLPFDDANAIVLELSAGVLARSGAVPVLGGLCGTDPMRRIDKLLEAVKAAGLSGIQNFPSVGWIGGGFRHSLEDTSLGYEREVEMIRQARELDLFTAAMVFVPEDAQAMIEAGADLLVIESSGIEEVAQAARKAKKDILLLAQGPGRQGLVDGLFDMAAGGGGLLHVKGANEE